MSEPNIERDKVIALANSLGGDDEDLIMALVSSLTVSEKRAEACEASWDAAADLADQLGAQVTLLKAQRDSLRSSLMRVEAETIERCARIADAASEREDGEARKLFCKPGEGKARHGSDIAEEIANAIRSALQASGDGG